MAVNNKLYNTKSQIGIYSTFPHKSYIIVITVMSVCLRLQDHTVAVWNIKSPTDITLRKSLQGHTHVLAVDFSKTSIISGSEDNTIKVQF